MYSSVFTVVDYRTGVDLSKFHYDLSIIIPIFNTEFGYLEKCLESLRDISHIKFEVVMVDDGSRPDYSTALEEHASNETFPLRLIVKENGGQNSARELGLRVSHGRYLLFLDSDDYIDPLLLERALDAAIDNEAQILTFNYDRVTVDGIVIGEETVWGAGSARLTTAEALLGLSSLTMALFDVSFLRGLGFGLVQGTTIGEDFASVISFASKASRIVSFGEPVYKYVFRPSSVSHKPSMAACLSILDSFDAITVNVGEVSEEISNILEWLAILHIAFWGSMRIVQNYGVDEDVKHKLFGWMSSHYPEWRSNFYLQEKGKQYGLDFKLLVEGDWIRYRLLWLFVHRLRAKLGVVRRRVLSKGGWCR